MMRNITSLWEDEEAVSPVIGVILMVAVTVVLAAVIGAFVFGLGDSMGNPAPNANLDFDYASDSSTLDINHEGGDTLTSENTGNLTVSGDAVAGDIGSWNSGMTGSGLSASVSGQIGAGDTIVTVNNVASGDEVKLVWESKDGGTSQSLGSFEAP